MADVVDLSKKEGLAGWNTYLVQTQASPVAKIHFLVFCWVWRLAVCCEPFLEQVCGLLGEVSPSFSVESAVVKTDVMLKSNVAI